MLTNMDTATNPSHEQDFNEKINTIKLKSSQEMKEAKQELNRQIQELSSENKELKYNLEKVSQEYKTFNLEKEEYISILLEKQHILEMKGTESEDNLKHLNSQLLEHKSLSESKETHIHFLEDTLLTQEHQLHSTQSKLEETYQQKLSEIKQMFHNNKDENEKA